jgi:DNA polymerase III sliding clamp (beta) subunit (PCNA family)
MKNEENSGKNTGSVSVPKENLNDRKETTMKLTIQDTKELARRCRPILSTLNGKRANSVQSYVKLTAKRKHSTLMSTDLRTTIVVDITALLKITREGEVVVPGKPFLDHVAANPPTGGRESLEYVLDAELVGKSLKLCNLSLIPGTIDFPKLPEGTPTPVGVIRNLSELLPRLAHAIGEHEGRSTLKGIFFDLKKGHLVATNGRVLHMVKVRKGDMAAVIPSDTVKVLASIPFDISISRIGKDHFLFENDMRYLQIFTRQIEGNFPNYEQVLKGLPKEAGRSRFTTDRGELIHALGVVKKVADKELIVIRQKTGEIRIQAVANYGSITERVKAKTVGKGVFGINGNYLMGSLLSLEDVKTVTILHGDVKPIVIKHDSPLGDTVLVMPMRLEEKKAEQKPGKRAA